MLNVSFELSNPDSWHAKLQLVIYVICLQDYDDTKGSDLILKFYKALAWSSQHVKLPIYTQNITNMPSEPGVKPNFTSNGESYALSTGIWRHIPYLRKAENLLLFKLDILLLTWTFIAGILKEMDQSATTQAYVSGMKESLSLYGNELVNFNTFFSVGYAIGLIPGQLIQTKVSQSFAKSTSRVHLTFIDSSLFISSVL